MVDPFDVLRTPVPSVDPDPRFAASLRARLVRALAFPEGVDVPFDDNVPVAVTYASLWLPDVEAAERFYGAVLGWTIQPGGAPQGRHVEGVEPVLGLWGGQEHRTTLLCFAVDHVAAALERVRAAGGRAGEIRSEPYGLIADCEDDQGMAFSLAETPHVAGAPGGAPAPGSLAYLVLGVRDTTRARAFFGDVLGWSFSPGRVPDGWEIEGIRPHAGMHGGNEEPTVVPMFAVVDVVAAVERVRGAGGTASDPESMPYGITSECTDDQGFAFYLGQLG